ncbi:Multidrug resistance protein MdtN [Neorhizobium galegae bv. orientalis]|nr:Multidrug resistance protein MdtN [Neorhizobium galegae bv. orientalis]
MMEQSVYTNKRTNIKGIIIATVILVGCAVTGYLYYREALSGPLTDDAIITANTVDVASKVGGQIISINVKEDDRVHRGDVLFVLDPVNYKIALELAEADLELAKASRDQQRRTIAAQQQNSEVAARQIDRARVNLQLAQDTLNRYTTLVSTGAASREHVDDLTNARDNAQLALAQNLDEAAAAKVVVDTLDTANANVRSRQAAVDMARQNLADTEIRALNDGRVVGLSTSTGQIVAPGQAVFTLVDTETWYASASYSETELEGIKVGSCARVYALSNGSVEIKGRVVGIGWGVSSEDLVNVPRNLPYVPKTLNWVRLTQRFPVRVELLNPPEDLTRIGASAAVVVDHDSSC